MKKQFGLLVILGILTISCGGKNEKEEESKTDSKTESVEVADCGCGELQGGKLHGKPYTGTCADKDQNDTIILSQKYKNGYKIYEKAKVKLNGKYIVQRDMNYVNDENFNGYEISIDLEENTIESYLEMKDGKFFNYYTAQINHPYSSGWDITVKWDNKNGIRLDPEDNPEESRPKCMPDAHYMNNGYTEGWTLNGEDKDVFDKIIAELKKEMPKFIDKE